VVPWEGAGLKPIGYGFESVAATITTASRIEAQVDADGGNALAIRQQAIRDADEKGLIATPRNSSYNELVQEAARLSILNGGDVALIDCSGAKPVIKLK
jgi:hypothetical protein